MKHYHLWMVIDVAFILLHCSLKFPFQNIRLDLLFKKWAFSLDNHIVQFFYRFFY